MHVSEDRETTSASARVQRVVVVAPCFNEAGNVQRFHAEVVAALEGVERLDFRILFIDDGSTDGTGAALEALRAADARVAVGALSRNFGHQAALSAGLSVCEGDAVIAMDTDLQHPPALLPDMIRAWRSEGVDLVLAVRQSTSDAGFLKRANSGLFYWLMRRMSDTPIVPGVADFYLLSARARAALVSMPEQHRFLRGMVAWLGFERALLPYEAPPRASGESKYGWGRMIALALDGILSFSAAPIRLMTRVGLGITMLGIAYLVYVVARAVFLGDLVQGWGSLVSLVVVLGGLQLVFLGVIGEYIARVFEEVKGRPLFLFREEPELWPTGAPDRD